MFKYSIDNLLERVGYDKNKDTGLGKKEFSGKYYTMSDGTKIPIMTYKVKPNDGLSRHVVLKTFLGYIPIENINSFSDIFFGKYLDDETEWYKPYNPDYIYEDDKENINKLSLSLGKHWKNNK